MNEVVGFFKSSPHFQGTTGICDISSITSQITLYTAAGSLQGEEIRARMDAEVALLYRHLDDGFTPINFVFPGLPLPQNRRRDVAQSKMAKLYLDVIKQRRTALKQGHDIPDDMLSVLMQEPYRDGTLIPDIEIANLMIALLMGGQHNTAATSTWILLRLAQHPHIMDEMLDEQDRILGNSCLTYENLQKLELASKVIKETLRLHSPIHSILRHVTQPLHVPETSWTIPASYRLLAAPGFMSRCEEFFSDPLHWDPHRWDSIGGFKLPSKSATGDDMINHGFGSVSWKAAGSPYLPFGAGRHRCVGEQYAYAQLGAIIATCIREYKWELPNNSNHIPETDYSVSTAFDENFLILSIRSHADFDSLCSPVQYIQLISAGAKGELHLDFSSVFWGYRARLPDGFEIVVPFISAPVRSA